MMLGAWPDFEGFSTVGYFFSGSILFPKIREKVLTSVDTFGCRAPHGYKVRELPIAQSSRGISQLSEKSYDIKIGSLFAENEAKTWNSMDFAPNPGVPNTTYFNDL